MATNKKCIPDFLKSVERATADKIQDLDAFYNEQLVWLNSTIEETKEKIFQSKSACLPAAKKRTPLADLTNVEEAADTIAPTKSTRRITRQAEAEQQQQEDDDDDEMEETLEPVNIDLTEDKMSEQEQEQEQKEEASAKGKRRRVTRDVVLSAPAAAEEKTTAENEKAKTVVEEGQKNKENEEENKRSTRPARGTRATKKGEKNQSIVVVEEEKAVEDDSAEKIDGAQTVAEVPATVCIDLTEQDEGEIKTASSTVVDTPDKTVETVVEEDTVPVSRNKNKKSTASMSLSPEKTKNKRQRQTRATKQTRSAKQEEERTEKEEEREEEVEKEKVKTTRRRGRSTKKAVLDEMEVEQEVENVAAQEKVVEAEVEKMVEKGIVEEEPAVVEAAVEDEIVVEVEPVKEVVAKKRTRKKGGRKAAAKKEKEPVSVRATRSTRANAVEEEENNKEKEVEIEIEQQEEMETKTTPEVAETHPPVIPSVVVEEEKNLAVSADDTIDEVGTTKAKKGGKKKGAKKGKKEKEEVVDEEASSSSTVVAPTLIESNAADEQIQKNENDAAAMQEVDVTAFAAMVQTELVAEESMKDKVASPAGERASVSPARSSVLPLISISSMISASVKHLFTSASNDSMVDPWSNNATEKQTEPALEELLEPGSEQQEDEIAGEQQTQVETAEEHMVEAQNEENFTAIQEDITVLPPVDAVADVVDVVADVPEEETTVEEEIASVAVEELTEQEQMQEDESISDMNSAETTAPTVTFIPEIVADNAVEGEAVEVIGNKSVAEEVPVEEEISVVELAIASEDTTVDVSSVDDMAEENIVDKSIDNKNVDMMKDDDVIAEEKAEPTPLTVEALPVATPSCDAEAVAAVVVVDSFATTKENTAMEDDVPQAIEEETVVDGEVVAEVEEKDEADMFVASVLEASELTFAELFQQAAANNKKQLGKQQQEKAAEVATVEEPLDDPVASTPTKKEQASTLPIALTPVVDSTKADSIALVLETAMNESSPIAKTSVNAFMTALLSPKPLITPPAPAEQIVVAAAQAEPMMEVAMVSENQEAVAGSAQDEDVSFAFTAAVTDVDMTSSNDSLTQATAAERSQKASVQHKKLQSRIEMLKARYLKNASGAPSSTTTTSTTTYSQAIAPTTAASPPRESHSSVRNEYKSLRESQKKQQQMGSRTDGLIAQQLQQKTSTDSSITPVATASSKDFLAASTGSFSSVSSTTELSSDELAKQERLEKMRNRYQESRLNQQALMSEAKLSNNSITSNNSKLSWSLNNQSISPASSVTSTVSALDVMNTTDALVAETMNLMNKPSPSLTSLPAAVTSSSFPPSSFFNPTVLSSSLDSKVDEETHTPLSVSTMMMTPSSTLTPPLNIDDDGHDDNASDMDPMEDGETATTTTEDFKVSSTNLPSKDFKQNRTEKRKEEERLKEADKKRELQEKAAKREARIANLLKEKAALRDAKLREQGLKKAKEDVSKKVKTLQQQQKPTPTSTSIVAASASTSPKPAVLGVHKPSNTVVSNNNKPALPPSSPASSTRSRSKVMPPLPPMPPKGISALRTPTTTTATTTADFTAAKVSDIFTPPKPQMYRAVTHLKPILGETSDGLNTQVKQQEMPSTMDTSETTEPVSIRGNEGTMEGINKLGDQQLQGDENNYEISDHEQDDSDWSSDASPKKHIPSWAHSANLSIALANQTLDPDTVFAGFDPSANLNDIFTGFKKKRRFEQRTSSGNWFVDRLRPWEEHAYSEAMGFSNQPMKSPRVNYRSPRQGASITSPNPFM